MSSWFIDVARAVTLPPQPSMKKRRILPLTVWCSVNLLGVLRLTVAKRPVLFADFNQTNEYVFPAQAETLVQSVCDCFVEGALLIYSPPGIERDLDKNAIFRSRRSGPSLMRLHPW
jgi:hypothetical protein